MKIISIITLFLALSAINSRLFGDGRLNSKISKDDIKAFIAGFITGAGDVAAADNKCVNTGSSLIVTVEEDVVALVDDVSNYRYTKIFSDVQKLISDVSSNDIESVCHFIDLSTKLGSPFELAKAAYSIYTHQEEVQKLADDLVANYRSGNFNGAGQNLGKFMQITFNFHTQ